MFTEHWLCARPCDNAAGCSLVGSPGAEGGPGLHFTWLFPQRKLSSASVLADAPSVGYTHTEPAVDLGKSLSLRAFLFKPVEPSNSGTRVSIYHSCVSPLCPPDLLWSSWCFCLHGRTVLLPSRLWDLRRLNGAPLHCPGSVQRQYLWDQAPLKFQVQIYFGSKTENPVWSTDVFFVFDQYSTNLRRMRMRIKVRVRSRRKKRKEIRRALVSGKVTAHHRPHYCLMCGPTTCHILAGPPAVFVFPILCTHYGLSYKRLDHNLICSSTSLVLFRRIFGTISLLCDHVCHVSHLSALDFRVLSRQVY